MHGRIAGFVVWILACMGAASAPAYSPQPVRYDPAKLHRYSDAELVDLLSTAAFDANPQPFSNLPPKHKFWDDAADELVARRATKALLKAFAETDDHFQLYPIADALARLHDPAADAVLHRYVTPGLADTHMVATEYFGKRCEPKALAILNRNFGRYGISSLETATIAEIFGNCRYRPAGPTLVPWVNAMVMNLGIAAHEALSKIYPDAHIGEGRTPEECAAAWRHYIAGLKKRK
jgi:hypothetical protein